MKKIHSSLMSVYYEDTDSTGYVYHSNYIKYAERARSNLVRDKFPELQKLFNSNEFFFVVSYLDTNFFKPARLSDNLKVETFLIENSFCSIKLKQQIFREFLLITDINVKLVWIKTKFYKKGSNR